MIGVLDTCLYAAHNGHLPALQYLHENGCPWRPETRAITPPYTNTGTVCSTRWITSARRWEEYAEETRRAPSMKWEQSSDEIYSPFPFPASSVSPFDARSPTATGLFPSKKYLHDNVPARPKLQRAHGLPHPGQRGG